MTAPELAPQRRGRRIALTPAELDAFLAGQRTCRVATVGPDGPHATPLWFTWHGGCLWLDSLTRSQRGADLDRDPRIGVVIDDGEEYLELRGVEITGTVAPVGEIPRTGAEPAGELLDVEAQFAAKYQQTEAMWHDGRHGWLKMTPTKIVSWDFRKIEPRT
jgi:hypothetical protein